jgi:5-methylthioadenosine/S-adenosylhomocysteine deaminase
VRHEPRGVEGGKLLGLADPFLECPPELVGASPASARRGVLCTAARPHARLRGPTRGARRVRAVQRAATSPTRAPRGRGACRAKLTCAPHWGATRPRAPGLSCLHAGLETLLGGGTAILDHLWVRHIEDVAAAVAAYRSLGIRVWLALMLGDTAGDNYANYTACPPNAADRNAALGAGCGCGGMGPGGAFRLRPAGYDAAKTDAAVALWEEAIARFHRPEEGINIAIGPVTCFSASRELITRGTELRRRHGLCGHIHLLETQGQALQSRQYFGPDGCVGMLRDTGFLALPGTSLAHAVWLDDKDIAMVAAAGASIVHNPASNLRLGSGVAPLRAYAAAGVNVALGADGACSSDGQDMHEVMKLTALLHTLGTREYRHWLEPRDVARMASAGGYAAVNMAGRAGVLAEGAAADVVLYDLTALSMLPRTDPLGTLVLGRPAAGPGGPALHSAWVRGARLLDAGAPITCDVDKLRADLAAVYPLIRSRAATDPRAHPYTAAVEREYRAALGLDGTTRAAAGGPEAAFLAEGYPAGRVLDDRTAFP